MFEYIDSVEKMLKDMDEHLWKSVLQQLVKSLSTDWKDLFRTLDTSDILEQEQMIRTIQHIHRYSLKEQVRCSLVYLKFNSDNLTILDIIEGLKSCGNVYLAEKIQDIVCKDIWT
jgi:hypothetical protein